MIPDPSSSSAKKTRARLDILVVEQGLAANRQQAQALIMAGHVRAVGQIVDKPGLKLLASTPLELIQSPPAQRYVSRGGLKLEHALTSFALDPTGLTGLDIGASTGGFTDALLQHGAARIFAIDVGTGQLDWRLRCDPRVVVMERTNIRTLASLPDGVQGECAVIDVAFISLRLVLPPVVRLLHTGAWIVALVKPQFEAGKQEADRGGGVIRDLSIHRRVLQELLSWLALHLPTLVPQGLIPSPITGREGNREYLLWLAEGAAREAAIDIDAIITS